MCLYFSGSHPFCYLCGFALLVNSAEHRDHRIANAPAMERAYKQKLAQAKSPAKPTVSIFYVFSNILCSVLILCLH